MIENLTMLASFQVGDKPVIHSNKLSKEERAYMVSVRRSWTKAFDPNFLTQLFDHAIFSLNSAQLGFRTEEAAKVQEVFEQAINGAKNLETTYRNEGKMEVAQKIKSSYEKALSHVEVYKSKTPSRRPSPDLILRVRATPLAPEPMEMVRSDDDVPIVDPQRAQPKPWYQSILCCIPFGVKSE